MPGQSRPLKRKSGDDVEPLQRIGSLDGILQEAAPTSDAQAVPATVSEIPRTVQVGWSWRQETKISNDMDEAQYDASVNGVWGSKRAKVDDDPAQKDQKDDNIPIKAQDDTQGDQANAEPSIKAESDVQEDQKSDESPTKAENDVKEDQNPAEPPIKPENDVKVKQEDEEDVDVDAITPASPRRRPSPLPQMSDNTTLARLSPTGTLTITNPHALRHHGVEITDATHITYTAHPAIPTGLQLRFLQSGSPIADNLVYIPPRTFSPEFIAHFTNDLTAYLRRWQRSQGAFGELRVWQQWPANLRLAPTNSETPHTCANCIDMKIMGEVNAPLCNWMPKEGDARTCRSCAVARRFCIVNVGGCPTVLRNPLDRVVDGVDGLGVAREDGGDW